MPDIKLPDEAVISTFMEPMPEQSPTHFHPWSSVSPGGWWTTDIWAENDNWEPLLETCPERERLGILHEVEARLTDEQWKSYCTEFAVSNLPCPSPCPPSFEETVAWDRAHLHADATTRKVALAAVMRPIVEGKHA
jgi:hypothetical protein